MIWRIVPLTMALAEPGSCPDQGRLADPAAFSGLGGRHLRPYQAEITRVIAGSIMRREGRIFTVLLARQMGKNEMSAQLEAYLLALYARRGGSIVKAAPSFKPQVINSILRLRETLESNPLTRGRSRPAYGYMQRLGRASIAFFSGDRHANVVGATASLLLEIDEAQDLDPEKYDRDFRPMAAATNATTVLYGTAWGADSILERQKRINLNREAETGERLHFEYDWRTLATLLPAYRRFVEGEIARLGEDHPSIQTQYYLRTLTDAGRLFSVAQRAALLGQHQRERLPTSGALYVAGIDLAGEDEEAEDAAARSLVPRRDSTVITIGRLERDDEHQPVVRVVEHIWWTGRDHVWQYERLLELWRRWNFTRVCVDASGIGAGVAAFLAHRHGDRVERFVFTAPSKSRLAYTLLGMVNSGRASLYADDGSAEWRECRREIELTRYELRANQQLGWGVAPSEGHDDFVASLALCCRAAEEAAPPPLSGLIRTRPDDSDHW